MDQDMSDAESDIVMADPLPSPPLSQIQFISELYQSPILRSTVHSDNDLIPTGQHSSPHRASNAVRSLQALTASLTSEKVFANAQKTVWHQLQSSERAADQIELVANALRACWMMGHWTWWKFLRGHVPSAVQAYLKADDTAKTSWITTLARYIDKEILKNGGGYVVFSAVFPDEPNGTCPVAYLPYKSKFLGGGKHHKNLLIHAVCRTVTQWLGLTLSDRDRTSD